MRVVVVVTVIMSVVVARHGWLKIPLHSEPMRIIAIFILLLLNAYFVAVEFALVRARRTRLEAMARTGDRLARVALNATGSLPRLLSASQLGITVASLALGALAEPAFEGVI